METAAIAGVEPPHFKSCSDPDQMRWPLSLSTSFTRALPAGCLPDRLYSLPAQAGG